MLFFTAACLSAEKKSAHNKPTAKRTIASSQLDNAMPGNFIMFDYYGRAGDLLHTLNNYCNSSKSFIYLESYQKIICVKK